jgi:ABC-type nitrate/sulfonate/bicarbonate transport system permease component
MVEGQPASSEPSDPRLEHMFIERERNRFAGRALALLVVLNGAAALVLMALLAQAPESTVDPKVAVAMMFFSGGAIAALFSSFLAYLDRTFRMQHSSREKLRDALSGLAIAAVIGSGTAFVMGMNMVARVAVEKRNSHPKGPREDNPVRPTDKA